MKFVVILIAVS